MQTHPKMYDILIAGSGFAGSIAALCLNSAGFSVCLVEREKHPRFAIGESSTPVADMILRDLSVKYDLPHLKKLSRYGLWQKHFPGITCGLKRGFSYYKHSKGEPFSTDSDHSHELLVAASVNDNNSDTQWYRPDVDQLFVQMVLDNGITYLDQTEIQSVKKSNPDEWTIRADQNGDEIQFEAGFIIDATGSPNFSARFFGTNSSGRHFHTNTRALYSHLEDVPEWNSYIKQNEFKTGDYPYNPDHSALHHILEPGWLWMLRFNNGLLSTGLVLDGQDINGITPQQEWRDIISDYPSLKNLFSESRLANIPGKIVGTGRLQRRLSKMVGDGWAALHHTAGFVDPLHSTGIAHSLAGVEKLVSILVETQMNQTNRNKKLKEYQDAFFKELELIDLLVAGCNKSRPYFDLFKAYTMLYFICSVHYEQNRLAGKTPALFLSSGHPQLSRIVKESFWDLKKLLNSEHTESDRNLLIVTIRNRIKPFNSVGLLDTQKKNMYFHTAVSL